MTAAAEVRYVPDGDPCPAHSTPGHAYRTRLVHVEGIGLVSQGQCCIDAFLDWFGAHTRDVVRSGDLASNSPLHPTGESRTARPPQLELEVSS